MGMGPTSGVSPAGPGSGESPSVPACPFPPVSPDENEENYNGLRSSGNVSEQRLSTWGREKGGTMSRSLSMTRGKRLVSSKLLCNGPAMVIFYG